MHHDDTDVTDELKEYVEDTECEDDMSEDEDDPDEDALFDFFLDLNNDTTLGIDLCEITMTSMTTLLSRLDHGAIVDKTKKLDEVVNISCIHSPIEVKIRASRPCGKEGFKPTQRRVERLCKASQRAVSKEREIFFASF
jgi:hypothetical protein